MKIAWKIFAVLACMFLLSATPVQAKKPADSDVAGIFAPHVVEPTKMVNRYLLGQIDQAYENWKTAYENRKTVEQVVDYQKKTKQYFIDAIGGFPERTALNARVVGRVEKPGYRVEKVIFESQPNHFVTAAVFLPDEKKFKAPYPGILVVCGHSSTGKGYEGYQKACALAATNGLVAMIQDPIDQGERAQSLDEKGKPRAVCCHAHNTIGAPSILLGRNTARFEIYDGMRGIDYLQSRPDIIPDKIGCMGNSGGGTQSAYIMALDDRVAVGSPSCYICSLYLGLTHRCGAQDAEQNIFGQLAFGMDHGDYCMMRAPRPTLLCTATRDFFPIEDAWVSYRYAKRLYGRFGLSERMGLVETDQKHGYTKQLREGAVRWMVRWLAGRDEPITEPDDLPTLTLEEIQCTPQGQVMLLDGARSVFDLNRDRENQLQAERKKLWTATPKAELVKRIARLAAIGPKDGRHAPEVKSLKSIRRAGYTIEPQILTPEPGIQLPAIRFIPDKIDPSKRPVVYLNANGMTADAAQGGPIEKLLQAGQTVLAVDLRGTGITAQTKQKYFRPSFFGGDGQDYYLAYLLGRSYVGMRTDDLLSVARLFDGPVELVTVGDMGIVALHAAAVEPERFATVELQGCLPSWSSLIEQGYGPARLTNLIHGALTVYDLPNLVGLLGEKVTVKE